MPGGISHEAFKEDTGLLKQVFKSQRSWYVKCHLSRNVVLPLWIVMFWLHTASHQWAMIPRKLYETYLITLCAVFLWQREVWIWSVCWAVYSYVLNFSLWHSTLFRRFVAVHNIIRAHYWKRQLFICRLVFWISPEFISICFVYPWWNGMMRELFLLLGDTDCYNVVQSTDAAKLWAAAVWLAVGSHALSKASPSWSTNTSHAVHSATSKWRWVRRWLSNL